MRSEAVTIFRASAWKPARRGSACSTSRERLFSASTQASALGSRAGSSQTKGSSLDAVTGGGLPAGWDRAGYAAVRLKDKAASAATTGPIAIFPRISAGGYMLAGRGVPEREHYNSAMLRGSARPSQAQMGGAYIIS